MLTEAICLKVRWAAKRVCTYAIFVTAHPRLRCMRTTFLNPCQCQESLTHAVIFTHELHFWEKRSSFDRYRDSRLYGCAMSTRRSKMLRYTYRVRNSVGFWVTYANLFVTRSNALKRPWLLFNISRWDHQVTILQFLWRSAFMDGCVYSNSCDCYLERLAN